MREIWRNMGNYGEYGEIKGNDESMEKYGEGKGGEIWGNIRKYGELRERVEHGETRGNTGKHGETRGNTGKHGEIRGNMGK
jgi:hypothetical protein